MKESLRGISMSALLWGGAAVVLALTWLLPDLRQAVMQYFGLYASVAVACGVGAVALTFMGPGSIRRAGIVLLLLVSWIIAVGWSYFNRAHSDWLGGITAGLGAVLIPVAIASIFARRRSRPVWTFAQVISLALLAAPLSSMAALFLYVFILRDGP